MPRTSGGRSRNGRWRTGGPGAHSRTRSGSWPAGAACSGLGRGRPPSHTGSTIFSDAGDRRLSKAWRRVGSATVKSSHVDGVTIAFMIAPARARRLLRRHRGRPDPAARPAARTIGFVRLRARSPGPPSAHYGRSAEQFPSGFRWTPVDGEPSRVCAASVGSLADD
jgi:hypothetical protein